MFTKKKIYESRAKKLLDLALNKTSLSEDKVKRHAGSSSNQQQSTSQKVQAWVKNVNQNGKFFCF